MNTFHQTTKEKFVLRANRFKVYLTMTFAFKVECVCRDGWYTLHTIYACTNEYDYPRLNNETTVRVTNHRQVFLEFGLQGQIEDLNSLLESTCQRRQA